MNTHRNLKTLFLAPHNDDEALFGAYTILRKKPLVLIITDGYLQAEKGLSITAEQRIKESICAMRTLNAKAEFLHIKDTELDEDNLRQMLYGYKAKIVYAPDIEGGNWQHDLVGRIAGEVYSNVVYYKTYTKDDLHTKGRIEIRPTELEMKLKNKALQCYKSQLEINRPHFEAVYNKPEYYA